MSHGVSQFLSVDLHKHTTQLGSREERIVCFSTQRDTGSDSQQIFPSMARARKTNSYSLLLHYNSKHLILRYLVPYCSEMQVTITQWETVGNGHEAHIGLCRWFCLFNFNVCFILLSVRFYCLYRPPSLISKPVLVHVIQMRIFRLFVFFVVVSLSF